MTKKLLLLSLFFISNVYAADVKFTNKPVDRVDNVKWASAPMINYANDYDVSKKVSYQLLNHKLDSFYKNKLPEMQSAASYIADKYTLPLASSEKIVLAAYKNSTEQDLNPHLVLGLIEVESTFKPQAVSQGGQGLMQVIPKYHPEELSQIKNKKLDIKSIEGNVAMGTMVLKKMIDASRGNVVAALQKYNGSFGDKRKTYSNKVLAKMKEFQVAATETPRSFY